MRRLGVARVFARVFARMFALVVAAGSASCGSSGDPIATGGDGGVCATIAPLEPCATCMRTKCTAESAAALGPGWASRSFGGACASLLQCLCDCGTSRACVDGCNGAVTAGCHDAQQTVEACRAANCGSDLCASPTDAGAGG